MDIRAIPRRAGKKIGSQSEKTGAVREYRIGHKRRFFQITTFCPEKAGPGPTNLYLIEDDGLILIDTGVPTIMAKTLFYLWLGVHLPDDIAQLADDYSECELSSALKLIGYEIKDIDLILLTHGHVDHFVLGKKLVEISKAKVAAHVLDTDQICNPWQVAEFWAKLSPRLVAMGAPMPDWHGQIPFALSDEITADVALKVDYAIMQDGTLDIAGLARDNIEIRHFPGHSPGAIGILVYDDNHNKAFLLCGDTILYPITPQPDDLLAFLQTLQKMKELKEVALTLPGHGETLTNLQQRVIFLEKHHRRRLRLAFDYCAKPMSIWQLATTKIFSMSMCIPTNLTCSRRAKLRFTLKCWKWRADCAFRSTKTARITTGTRARTSMKSTGECGRRWRIFLTSGQCKNNVIRYI